MIDKRLLLLRLVFTIMVFIHECDYHHECGYNHDYSKLASITRLGQFITPFQVIKTSMIKQTSINDQVQYPVWILFSYHDKTKVYFKIIV